MSTGDHPLMEGLPDIDLDVDPFDVEALKAMHPWLKVHVLYICTITIMFTRVLTKLVLHNCTCICVACTCIIHVSYFSN